MDCYILQRNLLVIILLCIIAIIRFHYIEYKMENNEFKKFSIKYCTCYSFDDN